MKKFGVWFNPEYLSKVSLSDFVKSHKHLTLSEDQLTDIWQSKNGKKSDEVSKADKPKK